MKRIASIALVLLVSTIARAEEESAADVQQRLAEAERRIAQLESEAARRDRTGLADSIEDYLRSRPDAGDAGEPGDTAGYDDGFYLRDRAGRFLLRLNGQMQIRALYNNQDESLMDAHRWGFENTRTKILASGHLFHPCWTYRVQGAFDFDGGSFTLEDAYVTWTSGPWSIFAGQFKCPVLREEKVDSLYQLAVERSTVNDVLTSGERFGGGVAAGYTREALRVWFAYTDGDGTPNTPALARDTEYAFTLHGEVLLHGSFDLFDDFTSFPDQGRGLMLGFNAHTQRSEAGTSDPDVEVFLLAVDVSWELGGANVFAELIYAQVEPAAGATRDLFGVIVHGGYFVTTTVEVFARYEFADLDDDTTDISIATFGLNKYIRGHKLKLTGDISYAFDPIPAAGRYSGFRVDNPLASGGQVLIRVQFQVAF